MPWGAEDFAAMTAELIEALSLAPCDIIAHSHGGRVALLLAAERPELVGKMVLTGAAACAPSLRRRSGGAAGPTGGCGDGAICWTP